MKKSVKQVLLGTGIAAAGLAVYSLWKNAEEPASVQNADIKSSVTSSKEFVEHRRQQIRAAAEARKAAQKESPQEGTAQEEAAQEEAVQQEAAREEAAQEGVAQEGAAQEGAAQEEAAQEEAAQEEAPDTVPVESGALEQVSERQEEQ